MADLHRGTRWYEVRLSGREVSGIISGALVILAVTFALGVVIGRRLATPAPASRPAPDHTTASTETPTPHNFTYRSVLEKTDPPLPPSPPPPAPQPPAKVAQKPATAAPPPPPPPAPQPPAPPAVAPEAPAPEAVALPSPPAPAEPAPEPDVKSDDAQPVNPDKDQFAVQFRAFTSGAEAAAFVHELTTDGYDAYVKVADIPKKGRFYRVRAGHFATRAEAEKFQHRAAAEHHLDSTVMPSR
jgi:cell division septation protein DedD